MGDDRLLDAYRRWGYLEADLDWLERLEPEIHTELHPENADPADLSRAREAYCGTLAVEFGHIPDVARRQWLASAMEGGSYEPHLPGRAILDELLRASTLEETLQSRYIGNKRFSIEGVEALVPLLNEMLEEAAERETVQAVLAMSHRGRLNVMAHVVGVPLEKLLAGFEDVAPRSIFGAGDVKYHLGATGTYPSQSGRTISIHLVSNPSHLEAVNPVAMGRVRAKQTRLEDPTGRRVVLIVMHGDAAFAGQGVAAETLNLAEIPGFGVGGTVHVVVNNLIGFTTDPMALHSSRFSSDVAKRLPMPIFHVNGEDADAVARAGRLAMAYRNEFTSDVVVDLVGYRRHGHSEIDDPTMTQPGLYQRIKDRPALWRTYAQRIEAPAGEVDALVRKVKEDFDRAKSRAQELEEIPLLRTLPEYWSDFTGGPHDEVQEVPTGIEAAQIEAYAQRIVSLPEGFQVHPKLGKLLDQRLEMGAGERAIDFGMAEALAFAALVDEGHAVRLSGQDSRRGTFSHRHAVLVDFENGSEHCPLEHVSRDQASFEIYNSVLSEAAVLGYEYGFSRDYPEALVAWEAQFGDFANGAQIIFDQFVTAGEDKWNLLSGLVVLLPHGYEGQGPEHSSARIERFLQLAAEDAIQIAHPSTAGQYFHLLRRQALRSWRKPLIVFTPKSMLRHPAAASSREELGRDRFLNVVPDDTRESAKRVLLGTGKIVHELRAERDRRDTDVAVVSIEQLYPFPDRELGAELDRFADARELLWVQEEPANMGALFFVAPRIERLARGRHLRSVKRSTSASPATGSLKAHQLEQKRLIELAFG
ncbi:MAG: 2-oxoglutarate dehydrogenase E1 component [Thermoanaerobaculia bacterium]